MQGVGGGEASLQGANKCCGEAADLQLSLVVTEKGKAEV